MAKTSKTSKIFLIFLLINLSSFFNLCLCDETKVSDLDQLLPGFGQSAVLQNAQCMQKLLPCQPFLKSPNNPPPACCTPLSEMAKEESDCLCSFLNNPKFFVSLDVTKDELMKLPNACGIDVDATKCDASAENGTTSSTAAAAAAAGGEDTTGEDTTDSSSSTKMITPYGITYFGVSGFVTLLIALVFSAY
ncbi:unnamed protein product [Lathyrus sativus]|nr:unnamed protein product [Lathyrus sativus]